MPIRIVSENGKTFAVYLDAEGDEIHQDITVDCVNAAAETMKKVIHAAHKQPKRNLLQPDGSIHFHDLAISLA